MLAGAVDGIEVKLLPVPREEVTSAAVDAAANRARVETLTDWAEHDPLSTHASSNPAAGGHIRVGRLEETRNLRFYQHEARLPRLATHLVERRAANKERRRGVKVGPGEIRENVVI